MKSNPRVTGGRKTMAIEHKYNYRKVLGFIATEGAGSTEPGYPYLSHYPDMYSNVYVRPVVCTHLLFRYLNSCNLIYNHNIIHQYNLVLEKYWVTHSGYFRLATTVTLGMVITDGKLLFCHGIQRKVWTRKFQQVSE